MNTDDFEKRLQRQPLRKVPGDWRAEILGNAASSRPSTSDPLSSVALAKEDRPSFLSALFWPHPKAWAALAAVWMLILAIQFEDRNRGPMMATARIPVSADTMDTLKDQQKILAELLDNNDPRDAEKPRRLPARPHSERRQPFSMT